MSGTAAFLLTVSIASVPDPPAAADSLAPRPTVVGESVLLSWVEPLPPPSAQPGHRLRFSRFADGRWSAPRTIHAGPDFFANWADVPALIEVDGVMVASWLQKSGPQTYAYDVQLARSTDGGEGWTRLGPVHHDGTQTEHGFVSMVPEGEAVRVFWLDGREMAKPQRGPMTLRTTVVGAVDARETVLDEKVCECCNTAAVVTAAGALIAYRDRADDETRDISIVRRVGDAWTEPRTVHDDGWRIAACPVNGPALAARGTLVAVAWYTGAAGEGGAVRLAFSEDGGATFAPPVTIDDTFPQGRVDVVLDPGGDAIVSWLDADGPDGVIRVRRVRRDGHRGDPLAVAPTSVARGSGFPRLAATSEGVLAVWTEDGRPRRLRARMVPFSDVPTVEPPDPDHPVR